MYVNRESAGGNLLAAQGDEYHVRRTDDHEPKPRQRWLVEVVSVGGVVELDPIERVDSPRIVGGDDDGLGGRNDLLSGGKL